MSPKPFFATAFAYALALIFFYSAFSKAVDYATFYESLTKSLFIPKRLTTEIGYGVIVIEIVLPVLLIVKRFRQSGFLCSFVLMLLFTGYIGLMVTFSPYLPCSCGGFIQNMTWNQHLVFNIALVAISLAGYLLENVSSTDAE